MLYNKTNLKIYSNVHVPVVMTEVFSGLSGRVQGRNRPALRNCERGLKECEIINQPKNDENFTSLINAGPRLNAGFK